mgnify:CR=1 FL=1
MKYPIIEKQINEMHGVHALDRDPIWIELACEILLSDYSIDVIKDEVKALNTERIKRGLIPLYFAYGHPLF